MMYERSQWVVSFSEYPINDQQLYSHAGYEYIHGLSPINIAPEQPPLGKYLIGLSILIFHNQRILNLIFSLLSLVLIWKIVYIFSGKAVSAAIAVFLTSINTLFLTQLPESPLFDIFQIFFFLAFIYFMLAYEKRRKYNQLLLAGVSAGAFLSVKVFYVFYTIFLAWTFLYFALIKTRFIIKIKKFIFLHSVALSVFVASYLKYFIDGGNLRGFAGVQKWIFTFYSNSSIDKSKLYGNYLQLIFFNKWRTWSHGYPYIKYEHWSVLWPMVFILSIFSAIRLWRMRNKFRVNGLILFYRFLFVYNAFLFIVPLFPRYLLILYVIMNIITAIYVGSFYES